MPQSNGSEIKFDLLSIEFSLKLIAKFKIIFKDKTENFTNIFKKLNLSVQT